jgi:hypothetical protein
MANFSTQYGILKVDDFYMIGNSNVTIDNASDIYVNDRSFRGTKGLWQLLTCKNPIWILLHRRITRKIRAFCL